MHFTSKDRTLSRRDKQNRRHEVSQGSRIVGLYVLVVLSFPFAVHATRPDSVVTFNEVMYHPVNDEANLEWIEFHNRFAVNVDLSGWSVCNGVFFDFPAGTVVSGGGLLVVAANPAALETATGFNGALGPFIGRLDNSGERLELCNNNGRIMDTFRFRDEGDWPVGPDGSGLTLAKIDADSAAEDASSWAPSDEMGGTPGAQNFADGGVDPATTRLAINEFFAPAAGDGWLELINYGAHEIALDGYVLRSSGPNGGEYTFLAQNLAAGDHLTVTAAELGFDLILGNKLFLLPPALDKVVDAAEVKADLRGRYPEGVGPWLFPDQPTPGATNSFDFHDEVVINEIMYHPRLEPAAPDVFADITLIALDADWRFNQSGDDLGAAWREPGFNDDGWPSGNAVFYYENQDLPGPKNTELEIGPITFYFRTSFELEGALESELLLHLLIDDGAVVYLNGVEVYRFNMPTGPITSSTLASPIVGNAVITGPYPLPRANLRVGTNVVAVEVHQSPAISRDVVFAAELFSNMLVEEGHPFRERSESWVELHNRSSTTTIDLTGWRLDRGIQYDFEAGTLLGPGDFIVVSEDQDLLRDLFPAANIVGDFTGSLSNRRDLLVLKDDVGNPADEVEYFDGIHWSSYADGGGASLELRNPDADNSRPGAWAASDESLKTSWRSYIYDKVATTSGPGQPSRWNEFIIGLLDDGEVLLDDISVIESPGGAEVQFISNGTFTSGSTGWRIIGNHRHSEIIPDPDDPGNNVLRLVSTGAQEHMHNHAETTIAGGRATQNGRTYRISYRAKWISGSNQLNTRLYFNRASETTLLDIPHSGGTPGAVNSRLESNVGPTYGDFGHAPIVPAAGESVVVSVEANDPHGVASLTLRYSVEGAAFSAVAMSRVGNVWSGNLPGQSAARLVQFYVEGLDGLGATSTWPPAGPESGAMVKVDDGLAADDKHTVRVLLTPDDTNFLHSLTNVMSNDRMSGTIIFDERLAYYDCGIRLKGSMGGRSTSSRVGFNVRFPRYNLFRGVHKGIAIDRSGGLLVGGHPGQDEIVTKHIIAHGGGVPVSYEDIIHLLAPRSAQNGSALLQMARFGSTFLDSRYENGSEGMSFELELIYYSRSTAADGLKDPRGASVISTDIANHGEDQETYRYNFVIGNNRDKDDYSGVMALGAVFSQSGDALDTLAPEVMDVDEWMRCFAYQSLCLIGDTYTRGGNNHNFRFYIHPDDNRAIAMPWDWDRTLYRSTSQSLWGEANLRKIIERPNNLHCYYGHLLDIIETTFNPTYMNPWITHYEQLEQRNDYGTIASKLAARRNYVLGHLPANVAFSITTNSGEAFSVDTPTTTLEGNGWIDIRTILVVGVDESLNLFWPAITRWRMSVPLAPGPNDLTLLGFDHNGDLIPGAEDAITVTSTFDPPDLTLSSVNPSQGFAGQDVTVNGTNFINGLAVSFGGTASPSVTVIDKTRATVEVPSLALGPVAVTAQNPGGEISDAVPFTVIEKPRMFLRGECNNDGGVDISDAIYLLKWLFLGGPDPNCIAACDANVDDSANISDAIYLLNFLFLGGPVPESPFPSCGPDPTPDELTCKSYLPCE